MNSICTVDFGQNWSKAMMAYLRSSIDDELVYTNNSECSVFPTTASVLGEIKEKSSEEAYENKSCGCISC